MPRRSSAVSQFCLRIGTARRARWDRHGETGALGEAENALPEIAVNVDDDARARRTQRTDLLEDALHVPGVVDEVGEDDNVEGLFEKREIVRVGMDEFEGTGNGRQVTGDGAARHLGGEVYAEAARRSDGRQQLAVSAADFEDALSRTDEEAVDFLEAFMIRAAPAAPRVAHARHFVPLGHAGLLVLLSGGIEEGRVHGEDFTSEKRVSVG